ncbi:amino acid efflux transporter [Paenibacillus mucilaginosus]|uniref:APC family permease n=1 Tax=Paenibacillus mucilaginosus TaxID=61624 RepID=UPI003D194FC6
MTEERELRRSLSWVQGAAMTAGAVLGGGILVLPALTAEEAGPASLLSWMLMSLLVLPIALTMGRLASAVPDSGGVVSFARRAFGDRAAYLLGWTMLGSIPIGVPVMALTGAHYVGSLFSLSHTGTTVLAGALILCALLLNARGIELAGWVQVVVIVIIALMLMIAAGGAAPLVERESFEPFLPHGWASVGLAAVTIFFCFCGWEMIVPLAEEFRNPSRDIPLSLMTAALLIIVLYLSIAAVTVGTGSYGGTGGLAPLSLLMEKAFGSAAGAVTGALALFITFSSVHTNIAGFSRMIYAQAREGELPGWLAKLHPAHRSPIAALYGCGAVFGGVLLYYGTAEPSLAWLVKWPSAIFIFSYIVVMAAALRLLPAKSGGRVWAGLSLVLCLAIYAFSGWAAGFPLGLAAAGALFAFLRRKPASMKSAAGAERSSAPGKSPR